jgi:hypothetical protein
MLSAELLDKIDDLMRRMRRSPRVFGGVQIVLLGDFYQLPVVNAEEHFVFESSKWGSYKFETVCLELTVKQGVDVAYPVVKLWVDKVNHNILKRQEFALSGRLMRTAYYPKWQKLYSASKKAEVWFPGEMRFFDEVEKSNSTLVLMKSVDLSNLDQNMFTKAWLESKSR